MRVKRSTSRWNKTDGGTCRAKQPFPWRRWLPWCRGHARQGRPEVTSYAWRRGDAPVKMIHKSEGFCLLTGIGGGFHGGGEQVEIAIGVDDFWYLRGTSEQSGTFGEAIALRFTNKSR